MSKLTTLEMIETLKEAKIIAPVGATFLHKKGGIYRVRSHAIDTDDATVRVLYSRVGGPDYDPLLEGSIMFARPLREWTDDRFQRFETGSDLTYVCRTSM